MGTGPCKEPIIIIFSAILRMYIGNTVHTVDRKNILHIFHYYLIKFNGSTVHASTLLHSALLIIQFAIV